jgi:hypothetical protein
MTKLVSLFAGVGLLAMGCASGADVAETDKVAGESAAISAGTATLTYSSDWGTGYCADVTISNALGQATSRWQVVLDLKTTTITGVYNAVTTAKTGRASALPMNYNTSIPAGGSTKFTFCASAPGYSVRPSLLAWNMESNAYATCASNSGVLPTKAALAVSAARELGRWDPLNDFTIVNKWVNNTPYNMIALSSTGRARCANGCVNTLAILGQQDPGISNFVSNQVFDPTQLMSELVASQNRQATRINDLQRNNPSQLPPQHKLTMVAGPTDLGIGACGPHYIFQADNLDGTPLSYTQASNLANALCFSGYGSCGGNPYLRFVQVTGGCPTGRTCVAIDPTDGDNSTTSTTTAGSAPTYPMNRVYDPGNSLLGSACITTASKLGGIVSKCAAYPNTCGFLYCTAF